jgi:hypothetical protein
MGDFRYGQPGSGPRAGVDPRVWMALGVLLAAGLAVIGFLTFVSSGGKEVAEAQRSVVDAAGIADDRQAQAALRNGLVAAKTALVDAGTYDGLTPADLAAIEPDLTFTDGPSPDASTVSVAFTAGGFGAASMSGTGTCFTVADRVSSGVAYGTAAPGACTGQSGLAAAAASW